MKRIGKLILTALTVLVALVCLASCNTPSSGPATATELYERIDGAMDTANSYQESNETNLRFYVDGYQFNLSNCGTAAYQGINTGTFRYFEQVTSSVKSYALGMNETNESMRYYNGSHLYISSGDKQRIYSEMTGEQVLEFFDSSVPEDVRELATVSGAIANAGELGFEKTEEGWKLFCSDMPVNVITAYYGAWGLYYYGVPFPNDIRLTIMAGEDFLVRSVSIEADFRHISSERPRLTWTSEYSSYGNAAVTAPEINISEYREIDDAIMLNTVDNAFSSFIMSEGAAFATEVKTMFSVSTGENDRAQTYAEGDFSLDGVDYAFELSVNTDGESYSASYEDGVLSEYISDSDRGLYNVHSAEAMAFLMNYLNPLGYSSSLVTCIEALGEGVYRAELAADGEYYASFYDSIGATLDGIEFYIDFTLEEGQLVKMEGAIKLSGYASDDMTVRVEYVTSAYVIADRVLSGDL